MCGSSMLVNYPDKRSSQKGFTLIELAVVLVIVGVLAGAFITTLGARIDVTRRAEAKDEMEVIKQALYGYAMSNNFAHLPCPDCRNAACIKGVGNFANDGVEDRVGAVCDVDVADAIAAELPIGNLPWITLGLSSGDAWGNRYSYWVSDSVSDNTASFQLADVLNAVQINTRIGTAATVISTNAIAIIMSHGKNSYGAVSTQNILKPAVPAANIDEVENTDDDLIFVARTQTDAGVSALVGEFDDIVIWMSEYELKAKMVEAGRLP